jgi:CrcB protein
VGHVRREPERAFAIGVVTGAALAQGLPAEARTIVGTGFLGAYTTFSTYAYEAVRRGEDGQPRVAAVYALASLVLGVAFTAAGLAMTGAL